MQLVMFDVDGTLVTSDGIDDNCYREAIREVLGVEQIDADWSHYAKVTDAGITAEIIEKHLTRIAQDDEILAVRQAYVRRLSREIAKNPNSFQAVPGALEIVAELGRMKDVCVCLATGGWRDSALLKLNAVGIAADGIPIATSDDIDQREAIMLLACEHARVHKNCEVFVDVLYVADHVGDFANATKLGYRFIGIAGDDAAQGLRQAGALHIMRDYLDKEYFLRAVGRTSRSLIMAQEYLGKSVKVTIDRPIGSRHPKLGFEYPVNYGYLAGVPAPDREDLDAFVLKVGDPVADFTGKAIAIIHRLEDDDDKLVVVPEGQVLSDDEIEELVEFQEKWFKHQIIREKSIW